MDAQVDYCSLFGFGDVKEKDVATTMERKLRPMPMDVSWNLECSAGEQFNKN